jgi:predicted RNase H-like HicB family nuclease
VCPKSFISDVLSYDSARTTLYSPATISLSSSSVRVALHSTLQTTHTQCDNIRQLFSALTSPSELSQLSEMYAPPSPVRSSSSPLDSSPRPFSFPSRHRVNSVPTKRSTWNGSYSSLAFAGSPTNNVFRRREKHRSNLSALFQSSSASAPVTPIPSSPGSKLAKVTEDDGDDEEGNNFTRSFKETRPFGAAALDLQRKNHNGGMEAFQMPPENYFTSDLQSPRSKRLSLSTSSGSRFTTLQTTRHPLSLSALHNALQGALASKRHACSHLLALRFSGDEDEGYWEDVRSVMGLLTSTFADASLRLSEALEELESEMLREQNPTPGPESSFEIDADHGRAGTIGEGQNTKRRRSEESISFAPMPSHISRFAAHVAAISSALDDARENLEQCVAALKEDPTSASNTRSLRHSRSLNHLVENSVVEEHPALQAYERLRRELGLALRECERGRGKLLDLVNPPILSDEGDDSDGVPGLGQDVSDDSDKQDPTSPSEDEGDLVPNAGLTVISPDSGEAALDDATQHLLLGTSTQHLPLPGVEQVFEADTGGGVVFSRERSKLTREERIKMAKARRESGGGGIGLGFSTDFSAAEKRGIEKWGPGGEVVQELKDVIWKVGEQRRKMADSQPPAES